MEPDQQKSTAEELRGLWDAIGKMRTELDAIREQLGQLALDQQMDVLVRQTYT